VAKRVLRWALVVCALLLTASWLMPVQRAWDDLLGPNEAQLLIVSAAPIRNVSVTYDGQAIESRPGWPTGGASRYAAFPDMRTRAYEPVLRVSWEAPDGPRSVSQVMRQADSGRLCLYVLHLDAAGIPVSPEPPDPLSPFWWTCHSR
jgi:hypothetical protein